MPYGVELPFFGAGRLFANEPDRLSFVDYLRLSFRWAGLPRLEPMPIIARMRCGSWPRSLVASNSFRSFPVELTVKIGHAKYSVVWIL
jgi:hypothetical protein